MRLAVGFAASLALLPATAPAQGVFNMGGLTQTLTIPTDQPEARRARDSGAYRAALRPLPSRATPPVRVDRAALSFRRDPAVTAKIQRAFIARFGTAELRAQASRNLQNATPKIVASLRPVGLEYTNLADAQSAYLVTVWQAARGDYRDDPAQFRAVSRQMAIAFARAGLTKMGNVTKQQMAETLLYDAMFMSGLFKDAVRDPALKRWLARYAADGLRVHFGLDATKLRMTPAGLAT